MPNSPVSKVVEVLRGIALRREEDCLSDGQLLDRYLEKGDEVAFATLVRRHGPMVWGVCQRIVGHAHDAEDAFQATFLILVRKAASVTPREAVGNWLYGVACHAALKARAACTRVRDKEKQVTTMPEPAKEPPDDREELQRLLDQELSALPDKYRLPVVLCELEGRTRKEVAAQLEIPQGTLSSRLATAHKMLAKRLTRHGLVVSGGALTARFAHCAASASVPASVVSSTIRTAALVAASKGATAGVVSTTVATLTEGVLKAMMMSKLKAVVAVVLLLGLIVSGATVLSCRTAAAQSDKPPIAEQRVATPRKQEKEQEGFTAWGKEVGGLQAGLGFRPGERRAYQPGETITLVLRVRNVGKEEVKFQYLPQSFIETPPAVEDAKGKPVSLKGSDALGNHVPVEVSLAPGKETELYELKLELRPASESGDNKFSTYYGMGKAQIQYERVFGMSSSGKYKLDPILGKLATGKLELEIKEEERGKTARKKEPEREKEKPGWIRDLDKAKKESRESSKDILLVFTGHGWCYHCDLLDREVFRQAAFVKQAGKDFVLVELDFTFGNTEAEKARAARYQKLQEQYLVRAFPTVILADADGVPYAMQSGYAKGIGVSTSLAMMRVGQLARVQRDKHFKLAESATGAERPEHLHKGIQTVAGLLGSIDDRGDDPVLVFYKTQVQDILKADAKAIRTQYEARQQKRDDWLAREAVFFKLRDFRANKDYRGAIKYLDEQLKYTDDRKVRWRLENARQGYLEWDGQYEEASKNARRLSEQFELGIEDKESLLDSEAYCLNNLGRVDDLLAHYDRRIAAAKDDLEKHIGLLHAKAEMLGYHKRPEKTMAAWRAYREAAKPDSEDWLVATAGLAHELRQAGQHRAALELLSEYLARDRKAAWLMLDAAESQIALGENDQARRMISQAEAASRGLEESTNKTDIRILARIDERMKSLRKQLDTK